MSRTTHSNPVRMLAVAAFLGVATMVAPAATHAQISSPERALLNRTAVLPYSGVAVPPSPSRTMDGESALLGRSANVSSQPKMVIGSLGKARSVDGEQALLNKGALPETRRLTVVR